MFIENFIEGCKLDSTNPTPRAKEFCSESGKPVSKFLPTPHFYFIVGFDTP